jgi:hypothetical protein
MDYSASIHDADNPAGASPWGSSPVASPRHARTSSYGTSGDVPPSPTPYNAGQAGNESYSHEDTMGAGSYTRPESSAGAPSETESDGRATESSQPQSQTQHEPIQQHRPEPQRYHPARQPQQPQGPQYKLQAKITGLERTGKKDPILRFDVHVSGFTSSYLYLQGIR